MTYAKSWVRVYVSECAIRESGSAFRYTRILRKVEHTRATTLVGEGAEARQVVAERLQMSVDQVDDLVGLLDQRHVSFECLGSERRRLDGGPLRSTACVAADLCRHDAREPLLAVQDSTSDIFRSRGTRTAFRSRTRSSPPTGNSRAVARSPSCIS